MPPKILSFTRRSAIPLTFSIGVHSILIAALCHISAQRLLMKPVVHTIPEITLVDIASFGVVPSSVVLQTRSHSEISESALTESVAEKKTKHSLAATGIPVKTQSERIRHDRRDAVSSMTKKEVKNENNPADKKTGSSVTGLLSQSEEVNHLPVKSAPAAASAGKSGVREPKVLAKVKPDYPTRALALRIEGWVKVQYDINEAGRVTNIRVLDAEPRNLFEREVIQAMKKWRFEAVAARDYVTTVIFKMDGDTQLYE